MTSTSLQRPDTVGDLIARGETHDDSKINRLATKVHLLVGDLRGLLKEYDTKADARAEVERLEAELAAAREKAGLTRKATTTVAKQSDAAKIRAWARENGHDVGAVGRVRPEIVAAYHEAQKGSAA